jgi:hypothetical protein
MSLGMQQDELNREIERAIVRSFGWSIIDFEAILYQKFLVLSASTSLMTEDMFRKHLKNMQAKGYVVPVDFQGKRAWKRLVIETDIDETIMTPEEVRQFMERAMEKKTDNKERNEPKSENVVSESKSLAQNIIKYLEEDLSKRQNKKRFGDPTLIDYIEGMHRTLAESKEDFLTYVRLHIPSVYRNIERMLESKGEEVLLLSLRVIESGCRDYPPQ